MCNPYKSLIAANTRYGSLVGMNELRGILTQRGSPGQADWLFGYFQLSPSGYPVDMGDALEFVLSSPFIGVEPLITMTPFCGHDRFCS